MKRMWKRTWVLAIACLVPASAYAHPGTGIVVDRLGQVWFVDMVSGVWKLDLHGVLTHVPGPAFHWMTLDEGDRFNAAHLPSGSAGGVSRLGTRPTLLLASDYPVATGADGNFYYPSHAGAAPLQIVKMEPSGRSSVVATLPAAGAHGPLRWLNGLAAGPNGSMYYSEDDAVRRVGADGRIKTVAHDVSGGSCPPIQDIAAKDRPMLRGLAVDSAGVVYVAATACGSVLRITPDGRTTVLLQVKAPWSPTGIALFRSDVYVLEFLGAGSDDRRAMLPRVRKISRNGTNTIIATVARH